VCDVADTLCGAAARARHLRRGDISKENFFYKCPVVRRGRAAAAPQCNAHTHASAPRRAATLIRRAACCAPSFRRRRQCDSGKNRFKVQEAAGGSYKALAAAKKQAKAAKASSTGERPRDRLRAQAIEAGRKMDEEKGRGPSGGGGGGDKKKGWFG
jgi:hypothetical protein